jgi:endonuclease-3
LASPSSATARPRPDRLSGISARLAEAFGRPEHCAHVTGAVENLVLTILSQNTTDRNRDLAYERLTARFPTLDAVADAPPSEIEEAIRVGGLAKHKAAAIRGGLRRIREERGRLDLDFLASMPLDAARAYLTDFPGVGVKTANILLLFSFGMPAFPVDTHILRVAMRLGLVPESADLAQAALALEPHVPAGEGAPLHLNLIRIGRELCKPRAPRCPDCPLRPVCPTGKRIAKGTLSP